MVPLSDADAALIPGLWDLRPGDADRRVTARVVADYGNASHAWSGYVDRVEAALDEQTRTPDVVVHVPQPFAGGVPVQRAGRPEADSVAGADEVRSPPLLVGKFVDVRIDGLAPERYVQVRRSALRPGNEVWAVRNGVLTIVPVRVLQRSDDSIYVTGTLTAGQPVIVGGIEIATKAWPFGQRRKWTTEGRTNGSPPPYRGDVAIEPTSTSPAWSSGPREYTITCIASISPGPTNRARCAGLYGWRT